jgi:hypothetical protein
LFENSEKDRLDKEEKERKRAIFARKLSKFGESVEQGPILRSYVSDKNFSS